MRDDARTVATARGGGALLLVWALAACQGGGGNGAGADETGESGDSAGDAAANDDHDDDGDTDADEGDEGGSSANCDPQAYFDNVLWPNVLRTQCTSCHIQGGAAAASQFVLDTDDAPSSYDAAVWAATQRIAAHDDRALLELKPTGVLQHGGGVRFSEGSLPHEVLLQFIDHVDGDSCDPVDPPQPVGPFYEDVSFIEPIKLLRRVTLALAGRLPTGAEVQSVRDGGMDAFEIVLEEVINEQGFYDRVKEAFGDILLTEGYSLHTEPEYVLAYDLFPSRGWYQQDTELYSDLYTRGLRYEPVEFIQHVLINDRPFHEIVSGDYMVVSPYSARGYNLHDGFDMLAEVEGAFDDPTDPTEFVQTRLPALSTTQGQVQPSDTGYYPHAGVLSTFHYTYVYSSTDSNRNRRRARMFYKHFLGVDIMTLAPAVTDAAAVTAQYDNPTMEAPDCVACHQTLDPVAGLFSQFDNDGQLYIPEEPWHDDMFAPGFEGESIAASDRWRSLQWLGERVAADDRFPVAMAEHAWYVLTQQHVATPPLDVEDPLYNARLRAYEEQRRAIGDAADAMVADDFNFKAAIGSLVLSEQYLADGFDGDLSDEVRVAELELLGVSALLTPEQLDRKYALTLGFDIHGERVMSRGSDLLYGGLDFRTVLERILLPNAVMGAKMRKWAGDAACQRVPEELLVGPVQTLPLFPEVDAQTTDEVAIRDNLAHLHWMLLGQPDEPDSSEVDRSFALFEAVRAGGVGRIAAGDESGDVVYSCRPSSGSSADPDYVVRAWQAVVTYLLRRPEFLSQ